MKKIRISCLLLFFFSIFYAQNVGLNISNPYRATPEVYVGQQRILETLRKKIQTPEARLYVKKVSL